MFSVHSALEEFKNETTTVSLGFVFEENSGREITWLIIMMSSIPKISVFKWKCLHYNTKTQSRRFQIPPVWRAFTKNSIVVTDKCVMCRNKAAFAKCLLSNTKTQSSVVFSNFSDLKKAFSKSSIFVVCRNKAAFPQCLHSNTKTQSWGFQIPPVWRAISKSSVFVTD